LEINAKGWWLLVKQLGQILPRLLDASLAAKL